MDGDGNLSLAFVCYEETLSTKPVTYCTANVVLLYTNQLKFAFKPIFLT